MLPFERERLTRMCINRNRILWQAAYRLGIRDGVETLLGHNQPLAKITIADVVDLFVTDETITLNIGDETAPVDVLATQADFRREVSFYQHSLNQYRLSLLSEIQAPIKQQEKTAKRLFDREVEREPGENTVFEEPIAGLTIDQDERSIHFYNISMMEHFDALERFNAITADFQVLLFQKLNAQGASELEVKLNDEPFQSAFHEAGNAILQEYRLSVAEVTCVMQRFSERIMSIEA